MPEDFEKENTSKTILNLSVWWKHVNLEDVPNIINKKDMEKYWRLTEDKSYIITLEKWQIKRYERSDTIINLKSFSQEDTVEATREKLLNNLCSFDWNNFVADSDEAYKQAKETDKKIFWFISNDKYVLGGKDMPKGGRKRSIIVLDFSVNRNNPTITKYPLDIYTPKETVKI